MDKKNMVIEDVFVMWNGCHSEVELYAETEDGKELLMATIHCDEPPTFANEELPSDATDYGEWYDEALEEAKAQGFVLGFQTEEEDKEEPEYEEWWSQAYQCYVRLPK